MMLLLLLIVVALQQQQCLAVETMEQAMDQRHNGPPPEKSVSMEYPTTTTAKAAAATTGVQAQELMASPCRPEKDGYFGGTYGDPAILQYAFAMESRMNVDISKALFVIHGYVMDVTVATTFPTVCSSRDLSFRANENVSGVTGFQFGPDYDAIRT
jgi:hypothetical protein